MLKCGAASIIITNKLGTDIQGAVVGGKAKYVRDELEANALFISNKKDATLLISCDLGGLEPDFTIPAREAIASATNLDPRQIIIGATHTGGPSVIPTNYVKPVDFEYLELLREKLIVLAKDAVKSAAPAKIGYNSGNVKVGYNRRCCWNDGQHTMGFRLGVESFTGLEGPEDSQHFLLAATDLSGKVLAILHQNTSHPCTFYGADFYSADYPGYARKIIRESVGDIPVLFFNGAFGDIGQVKMDKIDRFKESKEMMLARCGSLVAGETLRLLYETDFQENPQFSHAYHDLEVKVRLPGKKNLQWAGKLLKRVDNGEKIPPFDIVFAHGAALLQKKFGDNPKDLLPIHVIKLGEAAIVTQPTELFCQFGLDIKRRSPFPLTSVFSISDGYQGYCPTYEGIISGGYSGDPIYWTRLCPEAGYQITDKACELLFSLKNMP